MALAFLLIFAFCGQIGKQPEPVDDQLCDTG